jgi:hypothetical protein
MSLLIGPCLLLAFGAPDVLLPPDADAPGLIEQLGSRRFRQWEVATKALDQVGEPALEMLTANSRSFRSLALPRRKTRAGRRHAVARKPAATPPTSAATAEGRGRTCAGAGWWICYTETRGRLLEPRAVEPPPAAA